LSLFRRNYDRPGPGVSKDEPRKKGVARFFEVLFRDFFDLVKLNVLFCLCALPTVAAFLYGFLGGFSIIIYILSLIVAFPVGGAAVALSFCVTKMLRDEPGYMWHEFKRKFKENVKQAALPGIICTALIQAQVFMWISQMLDTTGTGFIWLIAMFALFLIFTMVAPYIFVIFAYVDLKAMQVIQNSILLSLAKVPRSIAGALFGSALWIVFILYLPVSLLFLPVIALFAVSVSWLLCLMWVWPPVNKQFSIEETINARRDKEND